jgi:hypothetical protein
MVASIHITRYNAGDVRWLLKGLRNLDKDLYNQMRRDFRSAVRPTARQLAANIPYSSPVSGLSPNAKYARQPIDQRAPYVWKKPSASIDVGSIGRGWRKGRQKIQPVLRIRFNDKRPNSAFSVLERASKGRLAGVVGERFEFGDRGRWVIPQFYSKQQELFGVARKILLDYAKRYSLEIATKFGVR